MEHLIMKNLYLILIILIFTFSTFAQQSNEKVTKTYTPPKMGEAVELPEKSPETAEEFYDYADKLWRKTFGRGTEKKVLEYVNKAIELNPGYAEAFYFRGFVNSRIGRYKESVADFTRTLEIDPDRLRAYESRAESKIKLKDFKGALADYDEFILRYAVEGYRTLGSLQDRGKLRYFLGDHNGAIEDFSKAISMDRDSTPHFLRGAAYLKTGDKVAALKDFKIMSETLDYIFGDSVKNYPDMYSERKGYPANENPLAVLDKNKTSSGGGSSAGGAMAVAVPTVEGDSEFKRTEIKFASFEEKLILDNWFDLNSDKYYSTLMISDESSVIYYHYGLLLAEHKKPKEAEEAFTKALSYNYEGYKNADAWFQRGKIRLDNKNFEPAVRDFSWAISQNRNLTDAYLERGIAILMLGHDEIAQKDFDIYLAINPEGKKELTKRIAEAKKLRAELKKSK